jgi:hypothetical protein
MKTKNYREQLNNLVDSIIEDIHSILKTLPDNYIQVQDRRGNLIINGIDDQESEVIQSVKIKDMGPTRGEEVVAMYGIYEEDCEIKLKMLDIDLLINLYESVMNEI